MTNPIERQLERALRALTKGDTRKCKAACYAVLAADPLNADAMHLLGLAWREEGNLPEALNWLRKAVAASPAFAGAWYNLADTLVAARQPEEAERAYRQALELAPGFTDARINLGNLYLSRRAHAAARAEYEEALAIRPDDTRALCNLGLVLRLQGEFEAAEAVYRRAYALSPTNPLARLGLGNTLMQRHAYTEAAKLFAETLQLGVGGAAAASNLGNALMRLGRPTEAIAAYRTATELDPANAVAQSNLLHALHYDPAMTPADLFEAHRSWGLRVLGPAPAVPGHPVFPHRPLRVGYVSADFRQHAVAFLFEPVLASHDRQRFDVFCYSNGEETDEVTRRIHRRCVWRDIVGLDDSEACRLIQSDGIDILVDLSGHTAGNRLGIFARRAAPIQVSWLGYFDTTGLATVDYVIGDPYCTPPEDDVFFVEKLWRLPDVRFCYLPPDYAPAPKGPPAADAGQITFGSFNRMEKVNAGVIEVWAGILGTVPKSRLLLKAKVFDDASAQSYWREQFARHGVTGDRLILLGHSDHPAMLAEYGCVDVALDTFPFTGGLTTLEALWMGVPVVTMKGDSMIGRQSAGFLHALGLDEWIAQDCSAYVRTAAELAGDVKRLQELRFSLRERMRTSPLCLVEQFCRNLEHAYEQMVQGQIGA